MTTFLTQFVLLFAGTLLLFAALSAAMSLLTRFIGEARLRRWLGGGPIVAPLKGLAFGVITPFCSWSTIPVLTSLLRARVRTSAVAAFFLASPVLDPVLIIALGWLFGFWVAAWFTIFLTVATVLLAYVAERFHLERLVLDRVLAPVGAGTSTDSGAECCEPAEEPWHGWIAEVRDAARFAVEQMRQLLWPLAITCAIGVAIAGAAPQDLVVKLAGPGAPLAIPAAAVIGAPLYLPTEALAPIGWAMKNSGVGAGAIFAFMITAASLSLPEFFLLTRIFQMRLIAAVIAAVLLIAVGGALFVPLIVG